MTQKRPDFNDLQREAGVEAVRASFDRGAADKTDSRYTDHGADEPVNADVQIVPYVFRPERSIPRRPWVVRNLLLRLHLTTVLAAGGVASPCLA